MPTGVRGDWKLTFGDEFDGTSLDTAKWSTGWYGSGITLSGQFCGKGLLRSCSGHRRRRDA